MNPLRGAAVVGQSGGPTAAINATLAGVIQGVGLLNDKENYITKLYGMRNGIQGFLQEDLLELSSVFSIDGRLNYEKISILCQTPAAALGSCRKKLPDPECDNEFYENLIGLFKKYDIRYFFYIGGNDSMDTVYKLTEYLKKSDYEMYCIGIPKTIDNDLEGTDHTPGYGSAAKYIAATMQEIVRDCSVYKLPAVTIVEIMGRDAGWLTASAALSGITSGAYPDFIYLPERVFDPSSFISDIKEKLSDKYAVVIAVSEGIKFADGMYVGEGTQSGASDVFGHKYLAGTGKALESMVKEQIGCKVRSVELNICQRCASHIASKTDIDESVETGKFAVTSALMAKSGVMVSSVRSKDEYGITFKNSDISDIANKIKKLPDSYINTESNYVTQECIDYIRPLIYGECEIKYSEGIPVHIVL